MLAGIMDDDLPTDLLVSAQIRLAAKQGVPITVVRRGDSSRGTILLKINTLDGLIKVYGQVRIDEALAWSPAAGDKPMPEAQADAYLAEQASFDPDCWILEIEDRQGRLWFEGKVLEI